MKRMLVVQVALPNNVICKRHFKNNEYFDEISINRIIYHEEMNVMLYQIEII